MDYIKKFGKAIGQSIGVQKEEEKLPEGINLDFSSFKNNSDQVYDNSLILQSQKKLLNQEQASQKQDVGFIWKKEDYQAESNASDSKVQEKKNFLQKFKKGKQDENKKDNEILDLKLLETYQAENWCLQKILNKKGVYGLKDFEEVSSQFVLLDTNAFGSLLIYKLLENSLFDDRIRLLTAIIFILKQSKEFFKFFKHNFKIIKSIQIPAEDQEPEVKQYTQQLIFMFKDSFSNFEEELNKQDQVQNQSKENLLLIEDIIYPIELEQPKQNLLDSDENINQVSNQQKFNQIQNNNNNENQSNNNLKLKSSFSFINKKNNQKNQDQQKLNQQQTQNTQNQSNFYPDLLDSDINFGNQNQNQVQLDVMEVYKKNGIKQSNVPNQAPTKLNQIDQIESLMKDFTLEKIPEKIQKTNNKFSQKEDPFDFINF